MASKRTDVPRTVLRVILVGPAAFLVSASTMAGMPIWFPEGAAGIDNLVFPLVFFPAIWALAFFYALLEERLGRATLVLLGFGVLNAALLASAFPST